MNWAIFGTQAGQSFGDSSLGCARRMARFSGVGAIRGACELPKSHSHSQGASYSQSGFSALSRWSPTWPGESVHAFLAAPLPRRRVRHGEAVLMCGSRTAMPPWRDGAGSVGDGDRSRPFRRIFVDCEVACRVSGPFGQGPLRACVHPALRGRKGCRQRRHVPGERFALRISDQTDTRRETARWVC
jgi:hypothetical protein